MANVPFKYKCVVETGFTMDPREQKRFGYVTALSGFGLSAALVPDLTVYCPFNLGAATTPAYSGVTYSGPSAGVPVATATVVGSSTSSSGTAGSAIRSRSISSSRKRTPCRS
jgi:hypothetical protein